MVLLSYEFTEASIVTNSEIEIQDRCENTSSSSDSDKDCYTDLFSALKHHFKVTERLQAELGTSSFSMILASHLTLLLFLFKIQGLR